MLSELGNMALSNLSSVAECSGQGAYGCVASEASATYEVYKRDGLGVAVNRYNPFYTFLVAGDATLTAARNGNLRGAGRHGIRASLAAFSTVAVAVGGAAGLRSPSTGSLTARPTSFIRTEALSGNASSRLVSKISESMRMNGWQGDPIKTIDVDGSLYIVDGHHRVAAARRAGIEVPYQVVDPSSAIARGSWSSLDDILMDADTVGPDRLGR